MSGPTGREPADAIDGAVIDRTVIDGAFYDRPVLEIAPDLLGAVVSHAGVAVRLTEVEAYDGSNDPGSHAYRGMTARTEVMFGPPGRLYVYFTYGMHFCANLVCGPVGSASAVLLRAGEVLAGHDLARTRRQVGRRQGSVPADRDLARGPARLTQALAIGRAQNGADATDRVGALLVTRAVPATRPGAGPTVTVRSGPRVGVAGPGGDAAAYPWRFWLADEPTVSAYRPAVRRPPRDREPVGDHSQE